MLVVQKYGGSSLADDDKIHVAAERAVRLARKGDRVVMVVSARGDTTDALIATARRINPRGAKREMDALLATGEQLSAGLMAMAIGALGQPAVSLTGWQAGIQTDGVYGNARVQGLQSDRITRELDKGRIVVVAGFQGVTADGDITTLGRGGSDTTAVALAAFLGAGVCQIYTDVDGVYDRDPRRFQGATRFKTISYSKMQELIAGGAQVLHDRCVEMAEAYGICIEVCAANSEFPGTLVGPTRFSE